MLLEPQSFPIIVNKKDVTDNDEMYTEQTYLKPKKIAEEENKKLDEDELEENKKLDEDELEEDEDELEEDEDELEEDEDEDEDKPVSKSNRKNPIKTNNNSKDLKNIDLTPINKSFDKSFKEIQKIQQTVQTLQKSLKNVEKQSMLNKQIQSEIKEINKKLMRIEKNTTTVSKPQTKNVNLKATVNKKAADNKKKKTK
jgi:hypothetical protein